MLNRLCLALLAAVTASVCATAVCAEQTDTMQAVVVSHAQLRLQTRPRPTVGRGQVLISVRYAGVNPGDWKHAMGRTEGIASPSNAVTQPVDSWVPGFDVAGNIHAVGAGVSRLRVGDAVIAWAEHGGGYAQYVVVPAAHVAPKPKKLSFAQAAGVPHAGLAAWDLLQAAHVQTGQTILVVGGAGGVGSAAVQIARDLGAHVIATASGGQLEYLKSLGAEQAIDYQTHHFEEQLRNIDAALNTVDLDGAERALAVVRRGGYLVSVAGLPPPAQCGQHLVTCAERTRSGTVTGVLERLGGWADEGRFKVNVDRTFALSQVLQAWQYSQLGHTHGKTVLQVGDGD